jgi:hypothetical protein
MPERLDRFLAAKDLDEVAGLAIGRTELSEAEVAEVRRTVSGKAGPLGRRNLLLHPEVIPSDLVVPALVAGLRAEDRRLVLAAVVGSHRAAGEMAEADRETVAAQLMELLSPPVPAVTRQRVSAALIVLTSSGKATALMPYLGDDDLVVRHNIRAGLVRVLGARGALAAVTEATRAGAVPVEALRFVDEGVDGGAASNHDLILRGVLAPQLVPITELAASW